MQCPEWVELHQCTLPAHFLLFSCSMTPVSPLRVTFSHRCPVAISTEGTWSSLPVTLSAILQTDCRTATVWGPELWRGSYLTRSKRTV